LEPNEPPLMTLDDSREEFPNLNSYFNERIKIRSEFQYAITSHRNND